jgi:hypothetical protein
MSIAQVKIIYVYTKGNREKGLNSDHTSWQNKLESSSKNYHSSCAVLTFQTGLRK